MKTILLLITLVLSFDGSAQILKRQSILSVPGIFQRWFTNDIPYKNHEVDFEDAEQLEIIGYASHSKELRFANEESTFAFFNTDESYSDVFKKDLGVCRGYSSLRRKFRHLAFFDLNNEAGIVIPSKELEPKEYVKFYKKLVKKIRKGQPTIIPGYANLRDFSADPELVKMMKWQVFHEWRNKNYNRGTGTKDLLLGAIKKTSYEDLLEMREKVDQYSKLGINTMIWTGVKKSTWIHVLEAVEVSPIAEDGSFVFKLWNDKSLEADKTYSYLKVAPNGDLIYEDFIDPPRIMNAAGVVKENDGEIRYLGENLRSFLAPKS